VLAGLRANKGWPRAIALVLLLAFSAGILHVHATSAFADTEVVMAETHDRHGHDHDGVPPPGVTSHCAFCAVAAGKFYLSGETPVVSAVEGSAIVFTFATSQLTSIPSADLFRPPIVVAG
jgi:uncharacterized membrane protein